MKDDEVYLRHILDPVAKVESYTSVGRHEFMARSHWQDAAIRQLEIISEATKNLSENLRSHHPDVPWRRISGLRDVLIHDYMGVRLAAVWEVATTDLPDLKKRIGAIIAELGS